MKFYTCAYLQGLKITQMSGRVTEAGYIKDTETSIELQGDIIGLYGKAGWAVDSLGLICNPVTPTKTYEV